MSEQVFRLHALPAGIGDALVLDYGTDDALHRVVIDGGIRRTSAGLTAFLGDDPHVELLVVTHIDNDHIAGMLEVLEATSGRLTVDDVWFNGFRHLPESPLESMGPVEGELLTTHLVANGLPWNAAFDGEAVMVRPPSPLSSPSSPPTPLSPPTVSLPGGLRLTVLSPGHDQLNALRRKWLPVVQEGGLDPAAPPLEEPPVPAGRLERMGGLDVEVLAATKSDEDDTAANGSSIALLAEWAGRSCLLVGDAHAEVLMGTLDSWLGPDATLEVDVFKVAHHGSKANVTNALMARVKATTYVFSSSGEGRSQHPNDEAVARTIVHAPPGATLAFNYRSKRTEPWDDTALKAKWGYRTLYPNADHGGLTIDVLSPDTP